MTLSGTHAAMTGSAPRPELRPLADPAPGRWLEGVRARADQGGPAALIEAVLAGPGAGPMSALLGTPQGRATLVGVVSGDAIGATPRQLATFAAGLDQISRIRPPAREAARQVAALMKTVLQADGMRGEPSERDAGRSERDRPRRREIWIGFETPRELLARLETIDQLMETQPYGYIYAAQRFADASTPPDAVKRAREQRAHTVAMSARTPDRGAAGNTPADEARHSPLVRRSGPPG